MKQIYAIIIILFLAISVFAQSDNLGTGAIINEQTYSEVPRLEEYIGAKTKREKWAYSLRKYSPVPGHQGNSNTCVGWAAGYGAMTIHQAITANNTDKEDITLNAFSPFFIFNQINRGNCSGALITDAMELLKTKGDCRLTTFYEQSNCKQPPGARALDEATNFRLKDYASLFYADDDGDIKIKKAIQAVLHDNPVVLVIEVTKSFRAIENGQVLWTPGAKEKPESYGHAMVVTGFNKKLRRFELMNSWGPNWGDQGFIWISFEDFKEYALYGFQLLPEAWSASKKVDTNAPVTSKNQGFNMSGNFFVLSDDPQSEVSFSVREEAVFDTQNNCYQLSSGDWQVYNGFKLLAEDMTKGIYLYLFSINPKGKIEYLYPLPKDINGTQLAHFIAGDSLEVTYPPDEDWLELEMPGTDSLIALFSWRAIDDIQDKVRQLSQEDGKLLDRLRNIFGNQLADPEQITFDLDKMAFKVSYSLETINKIVPLILLIEVAP